MAALSSCHQVLMKKGQKVVLNPGSPGHYATWTTTSPPRGPPPAQAKDGLLGLNPKPGSLSPQPIEIVVFLNLIVVNQKLQI